MIPKFKAWKKTNCPEMFEDIRAIDFEENIIRIGYKLSEYTTRVDEESLDNVILLQSTGLKDKNGTEIFIGDILEWEMVMGFGWYENGKDVVIYDEKELKIKMSKRDDYSLNRVVGVGCKVVGNKFEHPHLLEEE
ncbi:YopX family protein [Mammaliicoccus lentus]|uniref:YopX family protein n=1 Tax=Mammaliicoccus lentus TaxID=42858 RepID=UPI002DB90294|nr:YopX family protein [Mammaliicoccus lentus]MEB8093161.1 YopX family protein [Mammaliicoccus lentus]